MTWTEIRSDQFGNQYIRLDEAERVINAAQQSAVSVWTDPTLLTVIPFVMLGLGGVLVGLILLVGMVFTVEQQTAKIIERFGKFNRIAMPGLHFKIPLIEQVAWEADLRIGALNIRVDTKTIDDVFVRIQAAVQYVWYRGRHREQAF